MPLTEIKHTGKLPDYFGKEASSLEKVSGQTAKDIRNALELHATSVERGFEYLSPEQFIAMCDAYMNLVGGEIDDEITLGLPYQSIRLSTFISGQIGGVDHSSTYAHIYRAGNQSYDHVILELIAQKTTERISATANYHRSIWGNRKGVHWKRFDRTISLHKEEIPTFHSVLENQPVQISGSNLQIDWDADGYKSLPRLLKTIYDETPREKTRIA
jgi:hypothetical protein